MVYHALGGGHGHVLRGIALLRCLGRGMLVGPARLAPLASVAGVDYASAPAVDEPAVVRGWLRTLPPPALRLVDTFPRGPGRELDDTLLSTTPTWLVARLVRADRQGRVERAPVERVVWCEEPWLPARGLRLAPIHAAPGAVERTGVRRLLDAPPGVPLIVGVGGGDAALQAATFRLLRKVARRSGATLRFVSDVLIPGGGVVRATPAAPLLAAADVAVVPGGYHSVLDVRRLGVPAVIVPQRRSWDDQHERARRAANVPWRRVAHDPEALLAGVVELLGGGGAQPVPEVVGDGAAELAALVERRVQAGVLGEEEVAPVA